MLGPWILFRRERRRILLAKLRCLPHRLRRQPPRLDPRRLALGGITARVDNVNYSRSPANILELPWNTTAAANFFRVIRENQSCIRRRQKVQLTAPKKWNACDPSAIGLSPDFLR